LRPYKIPDVFKSLNELVSHFRLISFNIYLSKRKGSCKRFTAEVEGMINVYDCCVDGFTKTWPIWLQILIDISSDNFPFIL